MSESDGARADRRAHVLGAAERTYTDARGRSRTIRASALTSLGLLSVLVGFAGPARFVEMRVQAIPGLALVSVGLVSALAVLLESPIMVPYPTQQFTDDKFVEADYDAVLKEMLKAVVRSEAHTRAYNNRAAFLVNVSLSAFLGAVVLLAVQLGMGADKGLCVGVCAATLVVGIAWGLRRAVFVRSS